MRKLSRSVICLITLMTILSMMVSLAGCATAPAATTASAAATTPAAQTTAPAGTTSPTAEPAKNVYPLDTDVKLTYWNEMNPNVSAKYTNMAETPFAQELTKRTGVQVEYIHSTTDESFSLLIASQQLPDIIEFWWDAYPGGPSKAISDGVILPISDIMDKSAPNFATWLKTHPQLAAQIRWDEGFIVGFPAVNGDGSTVGSSQGIIVRKDLLDKAGLAVPETVDEWYTALKAFKDMGITAPFTQSSPYGYSSGFISRAYGLQLDTTSTSEMYLEGDKVVFCPYQPAFKEWLTVWHKWYEEGLIDPDIATVDSNIVKAKMLDGSAAVTIGYVSGLYTYNTTGPQTIQGYEMVGAPLPVLTKGEVNKYPIVNNAYEPGDTQAVITKACKSPDVAARFLDYLWSEEGNILCNWGIEGTTYKIGTDGKKHYTDFVLKNPDGLTAGQVKGGYTRAYASGPYMQDTTIATENFVLDIQFDTFEMWSKNATRDHILPPLRMTAAESEEYTTIMTDVSTTYKEAMLQFILGNRSLDEYDAYISSLKSQKVERAIEIRQAAYDRYKAKLK